MAAPGHRHSSSTTRMDGLECTCYVVRLRPTVMTEQPLGRASWLDGKAVNVAKASYSIKLTKSFTNPEQRCTRCTLDGIKVS